MWGEVRLEQSVAVSQLSSFYFIIRWCYLKLSSQDPCLSDTY